MTPLQITVDCAKPARLTRFWAEALGYVLEPPPGGHEGWNAYWRSIGVPQDELGDESDLGDSIVDPAGVGPRISFQPVPEPKTVKNRLHLDLRVSGGREVPLATRRERVTARADELVTAGAAVVRVQDTEGLDHFGIVLHDPEGNEFCLH